MNVEETTRLCKAIASIAPAQRFDDETPAIWTVILAEIPYGDARDAVIRLGRRQRFIAPADIREEVNAIRSERLRGIEGVVPDADPDDVQAYLDAHRRIIADAASGRIAAPDRAAIEAEGDPEAVIDEIRSMIAAHAQHRRDAEAAAREAEAAERARQLAALAPLVEAETATAAGPDAA